MALHDTHVSNAYDVVAALFTFDLRMRFKYMKYKNMFGHYVTIS